MDLSQKRLCNYKPFHLWRWSIVAWQNYNTMKGTYHVQKIFPRDLKAATGWEFQEDDKWGIPCKHGVTMDPRDRHDCVGQNNGRLNWIVSTVQKLWIIFLTNSCDRQGMVKHTFSSSTQMEGEGSLWVSVQLDLHSLKEKLMKIRNKGVSGHKRQ